MNPQEIQTWFELFRDIVLIAVPLVLGAVVKKYLGVQIETKVAEKERRLNQDAIGYAEQMGGDAAEKKDAALLYRAAAKEDPRRDKANMQIESELGKAKLGLTGTPTVHAKQIVIESKPPPPPVPS